MNTPLILVVEDEAHIAEVLEAYLRRDGYRTERAGDGKSALRLSDHARPDLVLLDVQLPELDGLEVLKSLRSSGNTPVILLTARGEDLDKMLGLKLGADDYVVKPFNPNEVVARVGAVLRRSSAGSKPTERLKAGPLEVDPVAMVAWIAEVRLELTLTEFRLLEHLVRYPNRTFSRTELLDSCWPEGDALERTVDVHLGAVRRKLEARGANGLLETVRGAGYRLWLG
jgi:two-component system, OmpR family, response regulator AdeR